MTQVRLGKVVGKNTFPDTSDVIIVQTCLANIRTHTKYGPKPLWQGKIDGKNSRELVCAIENFEASEGLKITGKVDPYGQTIARLRQKTSSQVLNKLSSPTATTEILFDPRKVVETNKKLATSILGSWPLPDKEAQSVAKLVKEIIKISNSYSLSSTSAAFLRFKGAKAYKILTSVPAWSIKHQTKMALHLAPQSPVIRSLVSAVAVFKP